MDIQGGFANDLKRILEVQLVIEGIHHLHIMRIEAFEPVGRLARVHQISAVFAQTIHAGVIELMLIVMVSHRGIVNMAIVIGGRRHRVIERDGE